MQNQLKQLQLAYNLLESENNKLLLLSSSQKNQIDNLIHEQTSKPQNSDKYYMVNQKVIV